MGGRAPHRSLSLTRAGATAALALTAAACATHVVPVPDDIRGYEIVVEGKDTLSRAFAQALKDAGMKVRAEPRGGARPAAALVHFVFQEGRDSPPHLYARLADTRTGRVVATADTPIDSAMAAGPRAAALVKVLLTPRS